MRPSAEKENLSWAMQSVKGEADVFRLTLIIFIYSLLLCLALGCSRVLFAESTGANFLRMSSPRAYALGQSHTASQGAQAMGANPANLNGLSGKGEISTSFYNLMGGSQYNHIAAAMALKTSKSIRREENYASRSGGIQVNWREEQARPVTTLGISITRLGIGDMRGRDSQGNRLNEFQTQDTAMSLGIARAIGAGWSMGLTGKAVQSQIANFKSKTALAADAGIAYTGRRGSFSLGVNNAGQGLQLANQIDPLPATAKAGISYNMGSLTTVIEAEQDINESVTEMKAGMEYGMGPVALRLGYRVEPGAVQNLALRSQKGSFQALQGFTTGVGMKMGRFALDYAVGQPAAEWGFTHAISMSFSWGASKNTNDEPVKRYSAPKEVKSAPAVNHSLQGASDKKAPASQNSVPVRRGVKGIK